MVVRSRIDNLLKRLIAFGDEQRGAVYAMTAIMLPVVLGMGLLAVDASRLYGLNTSLQNGADALALAGAAELDRKPDAITRANAAIANLVSNQHVFGTTSPGTVTAPAAQIHYLKSLPSTDTAAITSTNYTTDPTQAEYVEVTVSTQTLTTFFPAALIGGSNSTTTNATGVAGFNAAVCQFTPMYICDPYEGTGTSIFTVASSASSLRTQYLLKGGNGGSSQYFPGNYGWLSSPSLGNGASALRDALATVQPTACFVQNGVNQQTGSIANAVDAINVRFDLWTGPYNSQSGNSSFRPSLNVRKGYTPGNGKNGACNATETTSTIGGVTQNWAKLGQDSAFTTLSGSSAQVGNGTWDFNDYWTTNFGSLAKPNTWSNSNLPSRYQVYRYEIDNNLTSTKSGNPYKEVGTAACYSGGGLSDSPDRRILYAAIIACNGLGVHGNTGGPLPVEAFGKFFITEPASTSGIYVEMTGLVQPPDPVAHDIVQLVR